MNSIKNYRFTALRIIAFCIYCLTPATTMYGTELSLAPVDYMKVAEYHMPSISRTNSGITEQSSVAIYDKLYTFFNLFEHFSAQRPLRNAYMSDTTLGRFFDDLHIFNGKEHTTDTHLLSKINYTQTACGHVELAHMLANPITDITTLQNRQSFVQALLDDQHLFNTIAQIVQQFKEVEDVITPLWQTRRSLVTMNGNGCFFTSSILAPLNNFQYALEAYNRILPIFGFVTTLGIDQFAEACYRHHLDQEVVINNPAYAGKPLTHFVKESLKSAWWPFGIQDSAELQQEYGENFKHIKNNWIGQINYFLDKFRFIGFKVWALKGIYDAEVGRKMHLASLQKQLIGIKKLLQITSQANTLINNTDAIGDAVAYCNHIQKLFSPETSKSLKLLKNLLKTNTFKKEGISILPPHMGRILTAYHLLDVVRHDLVGALNVIGQLDAYLSIARLYKDFEDKPVRYSFAQYRTQNTPHISCTQLWNPFIDYQTAVPNDITFGQPNTVHRTMILTGSNTGGKSTFLKAMSLEILLAQTIGIVPAQELILTPFTYLGSSLNISDDTAKDISGLVAEGLSAKSFLKDITLNSEQFGFMVIDEPFKGATPESGAHATYAFAKMLSMSPYAFCILATHFIEETSKLESETCGVCKNYNFDADRQENGSYVTRHILKEGASKNDIADDILCRILGNEFLEYMNAKVT